MVHQGDVRDAGALRAIVGDHDAVVHLAFASNDPSYRLDPRLAHAINLAPMTPLLSEVIDANVARFVFLSSCSVYGTSSAETVDESSDVAPLTDYARHKIECEAVIARVADGSSLCRTILRPATLCGHSLRQRFDLLLNRMLAQAICDGTIRIAAGDRWRPVLPLSELVAVIAHILAAPSDHVRGATFNVAFECRTVGQWAEIVQKLTGCRVQRDPFGDRGADARSYMVSSERLRRATSYVRQHSVADSLSELMTALRAGDFANPLTDPHWSNLETQIRHDFTLPIGMHRVL